MNIKCELGKNIKKMRRKLGLSQEKFAEMIDIAPRTLYGIESGKNFVTSETLENIIRVFNVSPADLFEQNSEILPEQMINYIKANIDDLIYEPEKLVLLYKILKHLINN